MAKEKEDIAKNTDPIVISDSAFIEPGEMPNQDPLAALAPSSAPRTGPHQTNSSNNTKDSEKPIPDHQISQGPDSREFVLVDQPPTTDRGGGASPPKKSKKKGVIVESSSSSSGTDVDDQNTRRRNNSKNAPMSPPFSRSINPSNEDKKMRNITSDSDVDLLLEGIDTERGADVDPNPDTDSTSTSNPSPSTPPNPNSPNTNAAPNRRAPPQYDPALVEDAYEVRDKPESMGLAKCMLSFHVIYVISVAIPSFYYFGNSISNNMFCDKPLSSWALVQGITLATSLVFYIWNVARISSDHKAYLNDPAKWRKSSRKLEVFLRTMVYLHSIFFVVWMIVGLSWAWNSSDCATREPDLYLFVVVLCCITLSVAGLLVLIGIALVVILILFACGVFSKGPGGATKEILSQLTEINLGSDDASKKEIPDEDKKCAICLEEYAEGDSLTRLPCKHHFHKDCAAHWLKQNKTCPLCKAPIDKDLV